MIFFKNWVPIMFRFRFWIVLFAQNTESKFESLFSKYRRFWFAWVLFIFWIKTVLVNKGRELTKVKCQSNGFNDS